VYDKELRKQLVAEMNFLKPQLRGQNRTQKPSKSSPQKAIAN
jgi:hypothetical protein